MFLLDNQNPACLLFVHIRLFFFRLYRWLSASLFMIDEKRSLIYSPYQSRNSFSFYRWFSCLLTKALKCRTFIWIGGEMKHLWEFELCTHTSISFLVKLGERCWLSSHQLSTFFKCFILWYFQFIRIILWRRGRSWIKRMGYFLLHYFI